MGAISVVGGAAKEQLEREREEEREKGDWVDCFEFDGFDQSLKGAFIGHTENSTLQPVGFPLAKHCRRRLKA